MGLLGLLFGGKTKSPNYSGTSSVSNPFTTSTTTRSRNGRNTSTSVSLADDLQYMRDIAGEGANNNLDFLSLDPQQRVGWATSGQDPFYNLLAESLRREEEAAAGRGMIRAQNTGNQNSTAYGSFLGRLGSDAAVRQNQNLLDTLTYQDNQARSNAQINFEALNNLYNYVTGGQGASMSGMSLLPDLGGQQAQRNAAIQARQASTMGSLLNAGLTLAGTAFGGPLGGAIGGLFGKTLSSPGQTWTGTSVFNPSTGGTTNYRYGGYGGDQIPTGLGGYN